MMSPITVRADAGEVADVSEIAEAPTKKEILADDAPTEMKLSNYRPRSGAIKLDAALQRSGNHRPPIGDDDVTAKLQIRRSSSRNSNGEGNGIFSGGVGSGRNSEESMRSNGRKSGESGGRRSLDGSIHRKSTDSQRSSTTETAQQDDSSDQLSQITDILLARLISTLSDSTLGNPALLLQTLLGFSPDDYNDLLAALSESRLSYVDIISAYLHNIRVMSEDSGSTSAALSGTLTRSLIEQYNSLLAQAVKSPQSLARAALRNDTEGRSHLADLLLRVNGADTKPERRSFESLMPKGPSGLGFGRRHSAESTKRQGLITPETKPPTATNGLMDFSKIFGSMPKPQEMPGSMGMAPQGGNMNGITQEQLAVILQNAGMMNGGWNPQPSQALFPQAPSHGMNMMMNLSNPYVLPQMPQWTTPMQTHEMDASRGGTMGWPWATMGCQPNNVLRGWGGAGLETVPENFNQMQHPDPSCFAQAINIPNPHGQQ